MESEKSKLQAIFFDFDGVILDSIQAKTEGFVTLFSEYDQKVVEKVVRYHHLHGGISRVEKIKHAHENFIGIPLSDQELAHWAQQYSDLILEKVIQVDWIKGAKEFLDSCLDGIQVFVISGTPEAELKYVLQERGLTHHFDDILGSPIRKPKHIRMLLQKYALNPNQCVFVGDAMTDYNAAKETGLHFVGIQGENEFPEGTCCLPDCIDLKNAISQTCRW